MDNQINGDFGNVVKAAQLVVERLREAPRRPRTQNVQNAPLSITPTMLVQGGVNPGVYGVQGIPQVTSGMLYALIAIFCIVCCVVQSLQASS